MHTNINKRIIKITPLVLLFLIFFQLFVVIVPVVEASQNKYNIDNSTIFAAGGGAGGGGPSGTPGASGGDPLPSSDSADDEDEDDDPTCEEEFEFPGAWFICMIIGFIDENAEQWIDKVDELLSVGGDEYNTEEMRKAWSYFRNIASLLLMAIGLVMIIGQSISKE